MRNIFRKASEPLNSSGVGSTSMDKEEDIFVIAGVIYGISKLASAAEAEEIFARLDIEKLVEKIYKEKDLGKIGGLIASAAQASPDLVRRIVEKLDAERFVEKIAACPTDDIRLCVGNMG